MAKYNVNGKVQSTQYSQWLENTPSSDCITPLKRKMLIRKDGTTLLNIKYHLEEPVQK